MNKEATQLSDPGFVGHTELIGGLCGVARRDHHAGLRAADRHPRHHALLAGEAIARCRSARASRRSCGSPATPCCACGRTPRIAVAGLNPHAGENGLFGDEEIREIRARRASGRSRQGMPVEGPLPPDTLFYLAVHAASVRRHRLHVPRPGPHPAQAAGFRRRRQRDAGAADRAHFGRPRHRVRYRRHGTGIHPQPGGRAGACHAARLRKLDARLPAGPVLVTRGAARYARFCIRNCRPVRRNGVWTNRSRNKTRSGCCT